MAIFHNYNTARANSVFWSRALTIPLPRSFVFPQNLEDQKCDSVNNSTEVSADHTLCGELVDEPDNTSEFMVLTQCLCVA